MNEIHSVGIHDSTHQVKNKGGNEAKKKNQIKYGNVKPHSWKNNYTTM
jgi:hypothetical protein